MKISFSQTVAVTQPEAIAAYGSPAFYEGREVRDDIAVLEIVRHDDTGARILLEVRFAFQGTVSPAVRAVVDHKKMTWITRTEVRPAEARSSWEVLPDHYPDRLTASGNYRFADGPDGPESTLITVDGNLKVHVPFVGGAVERAIVGGLRRYIADEVESIPDALG